MGVVGKSKEGLVGHRGKVQYSSFSVLSLLSFVLLKCFIIFFLIIGIIINMC